MKNRVAISEDFEELVAIRLRAMKAILEKMGRFDKIRATERFRKSFVPEQTTLLIKKGNIIGFYMLSIDNRRLFLHHLYIDPGFQGNGEGTKLLNQVKQIAQEQNKTIELEALKQSRSNAFYCTHKFIKVDESEFDNLYRSKG